MQRCSTIATYCKNKTYSVRCYTNNYDNEDKKKFTFEIVTNINVVAYIGYNSENVVISLMSANLKQLKNVRVILCVKLGEAFPILVLSLADYEIIII